MEAELNEYQASCKESKFLHLLKPIRDLAENWNIDIASELEDYLAQLDQVVYSFDGGKSVDFAEAALLIQSSTVVWSKKVEYLQQLVNKAIDASRQRARSDVDAADGGGDDGDLDAGAKAKKARERRRAQADELDDSLEGFLATGDDLEEADDIDVGEDDGAVAPKYIRQPAALLALEDQSSGGGDGDAGVYRLAQCAMHVSGALLLDFRDGDTYDAELRSVAGSVAGVSTSHLTQAAQQAQQQQAGGGLDATGAPAGTAAPGAATAAATADDDDDDDGGGGAAGFGEDDDDDEGGGVNGVNAGVNGVNGGVNGGDAAMRDVAAGGGGVGGGAGGKGQGPVGTEGGEGLAAQGRGAAEGAEEGRAQQQAQAQAEEEAALFDPYAPLDPNAVGELLVKPMQVRKPKGRKAAFSRRPHSVHTLVPGLNHQEFAYAAMLLLPRRAAKAAAPTAAARAARAGAAAGAAAPAAVFDWTDANAAAAAQRDATAGVDGEDDDDAGSRQRDEAAGGDGENGNDAGAWGAAGFDNDDDDGGGALDIGGGVDATDILAGMRGTAALAHLDLSGGDADGGQSYEDLCRSYINARLAAAAAAEVQSDLAQRVSGWRARIDPVLKAEESKPTFDLQSYGEAILVKMKKAPGGSEAGPSGAAASRELAFGTVAGNADRSEVSRAFAAMLQLINNRNVALSRDDHSRPDAPFTLLLLTSVQPHKEMADRMQSKGRAGGGADGQAAGALSPPPPRARGGPNKKAKKAAAVAAEAAEEEEGGSGGEGGDSNDGENIDVNVPGSPDSGQGKAAKAKAKDAVAKTDKGGKEKGGSKKEGRAGGGKKDKEGTAAKKARGAEGVRS
ncbi:hypothetical protein FOA52_011014 [Chlamydomonas sp. UWO 241]|nr:hypothetical protein FOA52_011014 [Chlamydomonas sp. UWO 241]